LAQDPLALRPLELLEQVETPLGMDELPNTQGFGLQLQLEVVISFLFPLIIAVDVLQSII